MYNRAIIMGRIGKIESKVISNGTPVTNLSVVTSKNIIRDGEKEEKVVWHNVALYNKVAEVAEKYLAIGDIILVEGEIDTHKYQGNDGIERIKTTIVGHQLKMLPKGKPKAEYAKSQGSFEMHDDSDIPF